jgi:hypothetical protein
MLLQLSYVAQVRYFMISVCCKATLVCVNLVNLLHSANSLGSFKFRRLVKYA